MNIRFNYLYRDAGNFKQFGSVVFTDRKGLTLIDIDKKFRDALIDGEFFTPEDIHLPALQKYDYNATLDHDWHEFESVEYCEDPCNDDMGRDITALIRDMKEASGLQQTAFLTGLSK